MSESCGNCKFGRKPDDKEFQNKCHRYPGGDFTGAGDWCGEWKSVGQNPISTKPVLTLKNK